MKRQCVTTMVLVFSTISAIGCGSNEQDSASVGSTRSMLTSGQAGNLAVAVTVTADWPAGYCAQVDLTNKGTVAMTTWTVGIDLNSSTLSQLWSAQSTQTGSVLTLKPFSWNAAIAAKATINFGFCGIKAGVNYKPSLVSINGVPIVEPVDAGAEDAGVDAGVIACVPKTCSDIGANCGSPSTGCDSTLECGICSGAETCGGGGTPFQCGSPPQLTAVLTTQSDWPTGYCKNVTITNQEKTSTTSWTVVIQLNDSTLSQIWNVSSTTVASRVTAKSLFWNAAIAPKGTATFGFCGVKAGANSTPTIVSVTGTFVAAPVEPIVVDGGIPGVEPGPVTTTLTIQSDWNTGYCMNASVKNSNATAIKTWTSVLNLNQSTLAQIWNGQQTVAGSQLTVKPVAWNATIPAKGSTDFGFCANKTGANYKPTVDSTTGL